MSWFRSFLFPMEASPHARGVDDLFFFLFWMSLFLLASVALPMAFFLWKYRRKPGQSATPHITGNWKLEIAWTAVPLVLVLIAFERGLQGYLNAQEIPAQALEIQVTAQKWQWQFEYPDGTESVNELHVPVKTPVRLMMSSEDVIHDFFVPDLRIKRDVLPDRYSELSFEIPEIGQHAVECSQYCGKGHSNMLAKLYVDTVPQYEDWLKKGAEAEKKMPLGELGKKLYDTKGCSTCHSLDGTREDGPSWKGLYGRTNRMADGRALKVDENYLRRAILEPNSMHLPGYAPLMPTFQGALRDREVRALIEFIKAQE
ncbi:MAG: cytochrome c oxidase subunit II [Bryobacteraceae bacterium]